MNLLSARRGLLRLLVPLLVAAVVAGGVAFASATRSDSATPSLAPRTAAQLLADVSQARVPGLSGTVVETARLGLPELPAFGGRGGASLTGLLSGSHTVRVWLKGDGRSRLAITGPLAESDVIHNRQDLWIYSSEQSTAIHYRLPAEGSKAPTPPQTGAPPTPQELAGQLIAALSPTTDVQVERNLRVAGRDAYQLRLRPKAPESLIDSAVLAVDGQTKVPLRVQILAKGKQDPAFEVGFTQVQFRAPADEVFNITPPPRANVTERSLSGSGPSEGDSGHAGPAKPPASSSGGGPAVLGESWTSVLVVRDVNLGSGGSGQDAALLRQLLGTATPVQGAFGHGRLLRTTLLTVLLTDDGRVYAGAVTPAAIQAAAARPLSDAKPLLGGGR
jgi:outer membrane lipoprotein-sorting protein